VSQQKPRKPLYRTLVKRETSRKLAAHAALSNHDRWALANMRALTRAYPNHWFIHEKKQTIRSDRKLAHWFEVPQWISLA